MGVKVTNNAYGTLSAGIASGDTTITLDGGQGARFPTLGAGDYFYGTLVDTGNNIEVVKVTARSSDSMTVVRGQDNTTARAYAIGDRFELRPTAALFNDISTAIASVDTDVVNDTSPQLGGDLDLNGHSIARTGPGTILMVDDTTNNTGVHVATDGTNGGRAYIVLDSDASDGIGAGGDYTYLSSNGNDLRGTTTIKSAATFNVNGGVLQHQFDNGGVWQSLGSFQSGGNTYIHIKTSLSYNSYKMTTFRATGYYPYSSGGHGYLGCYTYGASPGSPYGQYNANLLNVNIAHSQYYASDSHLVLVLYWPTSYNGAWVEYIATGGQYGNVGGVSVLAYAGSSSSSGVY